MNSVWRIFILLSTLLSFQVMSSMRFSNYDIEDGLSQNTVKAIVQDNYGFMWFGTQDGLNRFDGFEFETFISNNEIPSALSNDYIYDLLIDKQGNLWIATRGGGLNRFNYQTETFEQFTYQKNSNNANYHSIQKIIQPNDNELWLATDNAGVQVFNLHSQTFSPLSLSPNNQTLLSNNILTSLLLDTNNNLWLGTEKNGLFKYSFTTEKLVKYAYNKRKKHSLSDNQITNIYQDSQNVIWVTSLHGLNRFQPSSQNFQRFLHEKDNVNSISHNAIRDIKEDKQQRLWLATSAGLNMLDKDRKKFSHFQHNPSVKSSLAGDTLYSIYITNNNMMWVGLFTHGLNQSSLKPRLFEHIYRDSNNPNTLKNNSIWSIFEDSQHEIWLGTDGGGLNHFNKRTQHVTRYLHDKNNPNSLSSNRVWAIAEEKPGVYWVATYDAGLNLINTKTKQVKRFLHQRGNNNSLLDNKVMALYKDSENYLWIATKNGLNKLDSQRQQFTQYRHNPIDKHSISFNYVLSLFEDSRGLIWVGTYGGGLNYFDKKTGQFHRYLNNEQNLTSISNNYIMMVSEDSEGHMWIATFNGINKLNFSTQTFTRFGKADGLINDAIYAILEGNDNAMWFSSNRGISRLSKQDNAITNFSLDDGLQSYEYNSGAFLKASTGELYFGGINGFNILSPQDFSRQSAPLSVTLTKLKIFNQKVDIKKQSETEKTEGNYQLNKAIYQLEHLTLSHKESLVAFEFSTLNYTDASNIDYEYKLENWDDKWIKTDYKSRQATYTNIPPGNYTLMLRAKNKNTDWGGHISSLSITVKPAPWLSWWAYSLYFCIAISLITFIIYGRYQRFLTIKENEERLNLSLWGSNTELWDWQVNHHSIFRANSITNNKNGHAHFTLSLLSKTTHPDDIDDVLYAFEQHKHNKTSHLDITYRRLDPQNCWRWYRSRAKAVSRDEGGVANRVVGTIENIDQLIETQNKIKNLNAELEQRVQARTIELSNALTELTQMQKQLVESEKMSSLVGLVTGVAHELNTPLGVVITSMSQLEHHQNELSKMLTNKTLTSTALNSYMARTQTCINLINSNITKSVHLVQNFKALSHTPQEQTRNVVKLGALFSHIIKEVALHNGCEHASISVDCPENLTLVSYGQLIKEVFIQLIENSCLHAFKDNINNKVHIDIHIEETSEDVIFTYKDNGEGLSKDLVGNVFDPFTTTKRGTNCVGLGMPIVYNQVTYNLLGSIKLRSTYDASNHDEAKLNSQKTGIEILITLPKAING